MTNAICIIETRSVAIAFTAANEMLNQKNVKLINIDFPGDGNVTVFLSGEYSIVKKALENGKQAISVFASYFISKIVTKPDERIFQLLDSKNNIAVKNLISKTVYGESSKKPTVKKSSIVNKTEETEIEQDNLASGEKSASTSALQVNTDKRISPVRKHPAPVKKNIETEKVINLEVKHTPAVKVVSENPTIERLKLEALGKKYEEKEMKNSEPSNSNNNSVYSVAELEQLNVHKLRRYARSFEGFPIKGREISKANRGELLNYFKDLI